MATYSTNSVNVRVGSSIVIGNNTDFKNNAEKNNIFKLAGENVTYEIAAVNTATRLTLSTRYANVNEQTYREESVATILAASLTYSGSLAQSPVMQNTVVITASWVFSDDGAGDLLASPGGTGTVDYDTGTFSITLATTLSVDYSLTASYYSGNSLNSVSYQIVRDYTANYGFPEAVPSDKNLAYIFTKAVRMIDTTIGGISKIIVYSDPSELSDSEYEGQTQPGKAGESLSFGDNVYCKLNNPGGGSEWLWFKYGANATDKLILPQGIIVEGGNVASTISILTDGIIRYDTWNLTATADSAVTIYADATPAGRLTLTAPTDSGAVVAVTGVLVSNNTIKLRYGTWWVERTT